MTKKIDFLIINASQLLTMEKGLGLMENGAVAVSDGKILAVGKSKDLQERYVGRETVDASGKVVTPGLVDCHTHLLFSGTRETEYLERLKGTPYLEILKRGGGILETVEKTRAASREDLLCHGEKWLKEFLYFGVTTVEIKSGYGLDYESEKKLLEVMRSLKSRTRQEIVSTFLGAHTFPGEMRKNPDTYLHALKERMLPDFRGLTGNCDLFLEEGAFSYEQADQILDRARALRYNVKIHANQINSLGGMELAKKYSALSVEHLDHLSEEEMDLLKESGAVAVLLPGASYFLREEQWAPARRLIDRRIPVALATDFNPGSSPSANIHFIMSLAVQRLGMLPDEVWPAVTLNAAGALKMEREVGSIAPGKRAHLVLWDMPNYLYPFYHFGTNFVEKVYLEQTGRGPSSNAL